MENRIFELKARKEVLSELSSHPTPDENETDSASQKASEQPRWEG